MSYLDHLNWRYATKRYNGAPVPEAPLQNILEAVRLAPSSLGLQPFDVFLLEDKTIREKLAPAAHNQPQITESGALLVFAAWNTISQQQVDAYINNIASTRNIDISTLDNFKSAILNSIKAKTPEQQFQWNARQAYIALGFATAAAALEKIDSTPMEGFNPAAVDNVLGLTDKGMSAVLILALGFRDEEKDPLAHAKKVRRPAPKRQTPVPTGIRHMSQSVPTPI
ncbi:nitroreductase family protein [Flavihumibacter sp. UBA7668]|uniref:nitroreductase family protein n=1 Tax=Flavihumibacter sp. UBA7668 TaxID=1946542 RepID=UPI0025BB7E7A|nr:nitroreductase family protein [Flavihumibacter sp. UBA7668]